MPAILIRLQPWASYFKIYLCSSSVSSSHTYYDPRGTADHRMSPHCPKRISHIPRRFPLQTHFLFHTPPPGRLTGGSIPQSSSKALPQAQLQIHPRRCGRSTHPLRLRRSLWQKSVCTYRPSRVQTGHLPS